MAENDMFCFIFNPVSQPTELIFVDNSQYHTIRYDTVQINVRS